MAPGSFFAEGRLLRHVMTARRHIMAAVAAREGDGDSIEGGLVTGSRA